MTAVIPPPRAFAPVLFSLKPKWADAIIDGSKRMEIRKTLPPVRAGTPCLIYATSPVRRVVGAFAAGDPIEARSDGDVRRLIALARTAGVNPDDFIAYMGQARRVFGIPIEHVVPCAPFKLPIMAPRSFQAVPADDPANCGLSYIAHYLLDRWVNP